VFLSFTVAIFQMMSLSGYLKFGKVWQVMVYVMVPFVMGQLFDELFALGFLSYIGIAITIFHANRLTQVMMQKKE
jgi:predicted Na+-dependent transporter